MDMMLLAFQTDSTRIITLVFANEGSNRSYPEIGVPGAHHELSHHMGDERKQQAIAKINHFHVGQLAYFLQRMRSVGEGGGNLLDHSMVLYGSGIADGDRHNHDDLPILLAGRGGGTLKPGQPCAIGSTRRWRASTSACCGGWGRPSTSSRTAAANSMTWRNTSLDAV